MSGLSPAGYAHSWVLGTLSYAAFGPAGYVLVCLYFVLGTGVSPSPENRFGGESYSNGLGVAGAYGAPLLHGKVQHVLGDAFIGSLLGEELARTCMYRFCVSQPHHLLIIGQVVGSVLLVGGFLLCEGC